jgi:hypothetical protein
LTPGVFDSIREIPDFELITPEARFAGALIGSSLCIDSNNYNVRKGFEATK